MIALWVAGISMGAIGAAVAVLLIIAIVTYKPGEVVHSLDCRDLYRFGLYAADCPMPHGSDYFATPRAQVELENTFDNQIGVHRG